MYNPMGYDRPLPSLLYTCLAFKPPFYDFFRLFSRQSIYGLKDFPPDS